MWALLIDEASVPVRAEVQSACELLGLDPVYVANEGKAVFFVAPEAADRVLEVLRAHPLGKDAARIGQVTAEHKHMLVARTANGREPRDSHHDRRAVAAHLLRTGNEGPREPENL